MDDVFTDAVRMQIVFPIESMDTCWEFDLSGMSLPVARAACRYVLRQVRDIVRKGEVCNDLIFITGVGRKHRDINLQIDKQQDFLPSRNGSLREFIRQVLRNDFDPPLFTTIPERAIGMVQVTSDILMKWIDRSIIIQ